MPADTSIEGACEAGGLAPPPPGPGLAGEPPDRALAAPDLRLLKRPLEFILAEHHRQRGLCNLLDRLAEAPAPAPAAAARAAAYIEHDMLTHVIDEEEDLFPLIRRRARPDDDVERVLGLLAREHAEDDRLADVIVAGLRRACAAGGTLPGSLRAALRTFAQRQRRHLAVENAVVMPLAEARLTAGDRLGLARRMAARRGIQLSREAPCG